MENKGSTMYGIWKETTCFISVFKFITDKVLQLLIYYLINFLYVNLSCNQFIPRYDIHIITKEKTMPYSSEKSILASSGWILTFLE